MKIYLLKSRILSSARKKRWCNECNCPWKMLPLSSCHRTFLGEKHFLQANEGKVNTFIVVNNYHAIHSIRDSIPTKWIFSCFRVVSSWTTSTSYKSLSVLRFRSTLISPSSFRGAHRILKQKAVEDMTFVCARVVACTPCNDHWRANVLICGQWVWYAQSKLDDLQIPDSREVLSPFSLIRDFGKQKNAETCPKFPSVLRIIDRSDRNPPIAATSVTF